MIYYTQVMRLIRFQVKCTETLILIHLKLSNRVVTIEPHSGIVKLQLATICRIKLFSVHQVFADFYRCASIVKVFLNASKGVITLLTEMSCNYTTHQRTQLYMEHAVNFQLSLGCCQLSLFQLSSCYIAASCKPVYSQLQ